MTVTVTDLTAGPFTPTGVAQVLPYGFLVLTMNEVEAYQLLDGVETLFDPGSVSVAINRLPDGSVVEGGSVTLTADVDGGPIYLRAKPSFEQGQQWSDTGSRLKNLNEALDRGVLRDLDINRRMQAASDYLDEVIIEAGSTIGLIGKADKTTLADPLAGPASVGFQQSGADAQAQTLLGAVRDVGVFLDQFKLVIDADDTAALLRARAVSRTVRLKARAYTIDTVNFFDAAGGALVGESMYDTIVQPPAGANDGRSLLRKADAVGTSAACRVRNIRFKTNGQNVVMVDLSRINTSLVSDCRFESNGAGGGVGGQGIGVRFGAPAATGSYTNLVLACDFTGFAKGVEYAPGANENKIGDSEFINCAIGVDAAPAALSGQYLDTPSVIGGRFEGCGIGIKDNALNGVYQTRFENSATNDIQLGAQSWPTSIIMYSAVTGSPVSGLTSLTKGKIDGNNGHYEADEVSRPFWRRGRQMFLSPATAFFPSTIASQGECAYFHDTVLVRAGLAIEFGNATNDNALIGLTSSGNTTVVSGFDRKNGGYGPIDIGGGTRVAPITDNATDLGAAGRRWKEIFAGNATINTSDRRLKTEIEPLDEVEKRVALRLKGLIRKFRWKDAVAEKGDAARIHVGAIAQDVIAAFEAEGLDPFRYSMIVHSAWQAEDEVWSDEVRGTDGELIRPAALLRPATEAGEMYSLRYEEMLAFIIGAL